MIDFDGFKAHMIEEELAENTVFSYMQALRLYAKQYPDINKKNLLAFKADMMERYAPQTVNLRLTALMNYCKFAGIDMHIKQIKLAKKSSIDNVISPDEYERLINGLKKDGETRWLVCILLLAKTGMRISEALKVTKKDILAGKVTMHTKAHMRTIIFPKSLIEEVQPYLEDFSSNERILKNHLGVPITSRGVAGRMREMADRYNIPQNVMHPHSFRHFFAIEFLKRNQNIALLADLLGHTSVNVTQIYLRMTQEQQQDAVDKAVNW